MGRFHQKMASTRNCKGLTSLGLTLPGGWGSRPKLMGSLLCGREAAGGHQAALSGTAATAASLSPAGGRQLPCISQATLQDTGQPWSRLSTGPGLTQGREGGGRRTTFSIRLPAPSQDSTELTFLSFSDCPTRSNGT